VKVTPRWVIVALLLGAVVCGAWAIYIFGFTSEPSAERRTKTVLLVWSSLSDLAALMCLVGALTLPRGTRNGRVVGWIASILLIVTLVGAIPGIAAAMGLRASRNASKP
jgi:peptidoglycan/LPS O-acetylase OafA/YrhL